MKIGAKLQLREEYAELYSRAQTGAIAFVSNVQLDEVDYEFIEVRWDPECWLAFNERPCWTFPDHFEVLEEPKKQLVQETKEPPPLFDLDFAQGLDSQLTEEINETIDSTMEAIDRAAEADGFIMICLKRDSDGQSDEFDTFTPYMLTHYDSHETNIALKLQLLQIAMTLQHDIITGHFDDDEGMQL